MKKRPCSPKNNRRVKGQGHEHHARMIMTKTTGRQRKRVWFMPAFIRVMLRKNTGGILETRFPAVRGRWNGPVVRDGDVGMFAGRFRTASLY